MKGCPKLFKGIRQSQKIIRKFDPDLVVGFGSFFTLPLLVAAHLEKIPIILHEQNAIPGKVNRLFSNYAAATAITFPATRDYLKRKAKKQAVEVLFPSREKPNTTLEHAWNYFGLEPHENRPTLLIFGGSQGAVKLNHLILETLPLLPPVQVLHFTGNEARAEEARTVYEKCLIPACVKAFEPRMDLAMQIADCAITRAGAATISELIEYELPSLLIPYPYATENHQEINGSHFVSIVKGGKMYKEEELKAPLLAEAILQHLSDRSTKKKHIAAYKTGRAALHLADYIKDFSYGK